MFTGAETSPHEALMILVFFLKHFSAIKMKEYC